MDDTENIYVIDDSLYRELERINGYDFFIITDEISSKEDCYWTVYKAQ